ncbi:MAG TPA: threonylcarbamoyl-AMP synthase [Gammaproteobacteria bacterium]|nr:threonylcarbamoyl-AMP synthase [Gammaproteobacteria bacterium]
MSQLFQIHPDNPQPRLIRQAVQIVQQGGVVALPTDSCYALVCHLDDKAAVERIQSIRQLDKHHNFTLLCADLSQIASYARVDNPTYRLLRAHTPGPWTFILRATGEVPKRLQHKKRKTVGIRVPDHTVTGALLAEHGQALMGVTLMLPGADFPETDPAEVRQRLQHQIELVIDGGHCGVEPTSVVDLTGPQPAVIRIGKGPVENFQ